MIINNLKELLDKGKLEYDDRIYFGQYHYCVGFSNLYLINGGTNDTIFEISIVKNKYKFCSDAYGYRSDIGSFPCYANSDYEAAYRVAVKIYTDILGENIVPLKDRNLNEVKEFPIGTKVNVIDIGYLYSTHKKVADKIGCKNFISGERVHSYEGFTVVGSYVDKINNFIAIEKDGREYIIGSQGLEIVKEYKYRIIYIKIDSSDVGSSKWAEQKMKSLGYELCKINETEEHNSGSLYLIGTRYGFYYFDYVEENDMLLSSYVEYVNEYDQDETDLIVPEDKEVYQYLKDNTKQMYKVGDTIKIIGNKSQHDLLFGKYIISNILIDPKHYDQSYVEVYGSNKSIGFYDIEPVQLSGTDTGCASGDYSTVTTVNTVTKSVVNTDTILKNNIKQMKTYNEIQIEKFFSDKKNADSIELTIDKLESLRLLLRDTARDIGKVEDKVISLLNNINSYIDRGDIKTLKQKLKEYPALIEYVDNYITTPIKDLVNVEIKEVTPDVFFKR